MNLTHSYFCVGLNIKIIAIQNFDDNDYEHKVGNTFVWVLFFQEIEIIHSNPLKLKLFEHLQCKKRY